MTIEGGECVKNRQLGMKCSFMKRGGGGVPENGREIEWNLPNSGEMNNNKMFIIIAK